MISSSSACSKSVSCRFQTASITHPRRSFRVAIVKPPNCSHRGGGRRNAYSHCIECLSFHVRAYNCAKYPLNAHLEGTWLDDLMVKAMIRLRHERFSVERCHIGRIGDIIAVQEDAIVCPVTDVIIHPCERLGTAGSRFNTIVIFRLRFALRVVGVHRTQVEEGTRISG